MFIAIRDLRFARGRFALLGGVVALMTLMVVALTGLTAGLRAAAVSAVDRLPTAYLALEQPPDGAQPSFATSTLTAEQVAALGAYPLGISTNRLAAGGRTTAVTVFGADAALLPPLRRGAAGGLALPADLAADLGLSPGDPVELGGHPQTVSALVEPVSFSHLPVVYLPVPAWQALARTDTVTAVALAAPPAAPVPGTVLRTRAQSRDAVGGFSSEQGSLDLMRGLLLVVSALVVGAFFTVWTVQRTPDLAVVRALGAGRAYLLRDALGQAAAVLLAGAVLGGAAATGLGLLAARAVPYVADASTVAPPLLAMVGVGLLGAVVAVRRVAAVDPITALGSAR
ncbi:ABC transporter permease [Catellatospora sp. KI3]|uniref:FtsX-like permease family protein n=1 Tax=Catellatospora sp. KI3 TaxID=3041620 RepID=UPI002482CA80|nr:FtsX-like permease family protein [Catellatospora sp. KI3]MDI1463929.1 ABC transporter permease [Catellatospora sp. KI3]